MNSQRPLIIGTILFTSAVLASSLFNWQNGLEILSSQTTLFDIIRGSIIAVLMLLLVTSIPRKFIIRATLGAIGLLLSVMAIALVATYQAEVFDAVTLVIVSIICFIEALEVRYKKIPVQVKKSIAHMVVVK